MKRPHRFTLRSKIGCRPVPGLPSRVLTAIGVYVVSCILGWSAVAVLIAVVIRT